VNASIARALEPFERQDAAENPFRIQQDLQGMMQDLVGIVRREDEMREALGKLAALKERAARTSVTGHREYHTGWHTAQDLDHLLTVSEAITVSALERRESRGGHFRDDYPQKDPAFATFNIAVHRTPEGGMAVSRVPIPELPDELRKIIEENA